MNRRSFVFGALGFAAPLRAASASTRAAIHPSRLSADDILHFDFPQEQGIYTTISVNGVRSRALIDSGATRSIVSNRLAEQLGLRVVGHEAMYAQTGVVQAGETSGVSVIAGRDAPVWLRPGCLDLSQLAGPTGYGPEIILGLDYLRQREVSVDFSRSSLAIASDVSGSVPLSAIAAQNGPLGACCIPIRVAGQDVLAMFDTGNAAALSISPEVFAALRTPSTRVSDAVTAGAEGLSTESIFSLPSLVVAGERIQDVPATSLTSWRNPMQAVIGLPVISRFQVQLALGAGWLAMAPDERRMKRAFLRDLTGLGLKFDTDRLTVVHVATGSPASKNDFTIGEAIIAIDGEAVGAIYRRSNMWRWRYDPRLAPISLMMSNGESRQIRLRRYY